MSNQITKKSRFTIERLEDRIAPSACAFVPPVCGTPAPPKDDFSSAGAPKDDFSSSSCSNNPTPVGHNGGSNNGGSHDGDHSGNGKSPAHKGGSHKGGSHKR